jgi:hypothetical protein
MPLETCFTLKLSFTKVSHLAIVQTPLNEKDDDYNSKTNRQQHIHQLFKIYEVFDLLHIMNF